MAKRKRPATGDARKTNQPLKIDKLPPSVHDAILSLKNKQLKTWEEIERLSSLPLKEGGFVDWEKLSTPVLELFPDMRLPHTNLHRWYDLRFAQVRRDVLERSEQARIVAEAFSKSIVENGDDAVLNAARDTIMAVLSEDDTKAGRTNVTRALIALAEVMQTARANDIKERKVAVDERKLAQMEKDAEAKRQKMDQETAKVAKKGELTLDDINKLRRNTFGLPPLGPDGQVIAQ